MAASRKGIPVDALLELLQHRRCPEHVVVVRHLVPIDLVLVFFEQLFTPWKIGGEVLPCLFVHNLLHEVVAPSLFILRRDIAAPFIIYHIHLFYWFLIQR